MKYNEFERFVYKWWLFQFQIIFDRSHSGYTFWKVQKCNTSFINKLKLDLSHRHFHILESIVIAILLVPRVSSFITRFGGVGWWHYPFRLSQCVCVRVSDESRTGMASPHTHAHVCACTCRASFELLFSTLLQYPEYKQAFGASAFRARLWKDNNGKNAVNKNEGLFELLEATKLNSCCCLQMRLSLKLLWITHIFSSRDHPQSHTFVEQ